MLKRLLISFFLFGLLLPATTNASTELVVELGGTFKAKVIEIIQSEIRVVPGTAVPSSFQRIEAEILEGEKKGEYVVLENDYLILKPGEIFYVLYSRDFEGRETYAVSEPYRLSSLLILGVIFLGVLFLFGGIQGVRGFLSLLGSLFLIGYLLLPGLFAGYSPILLSIGISSVIIIIGSYVTHGFNKTTSAAVIGMILTVLITGGLAYWSVDATRLSGFSSDEAMYLNLDTEGRIDFAGLLLGAIMIGLLGVLYDVSIGQAVSVEEIMRAGPGLGAKAVYQRASRIGKEHIGALINTLAIAYVGASLPLLLLFYSSSSSFLNLLNREIFAVEIVRTMVGSIGLILAVPITTLITVFILKRFPLREGSSISHHHH